MNAGENGLVAVIVIGGFALNVWTFLEQLKRPDVHVVDAARSEDEVYASIKQYLTHIGLSP